MGRPRLKDKDLPERMYRKHGAYWYVLGGEWQRLRTDYAASLAAYAALHEGARGSGMAALIDKVLAHTAPKLRPSTVKQYAVCAKQLKKMLAEFSPEQVQPRHIAGIKVALASKPNFANRCLSPARCLRSRC